MRDGAFLNKGGWRVGLAREGERGGGAGGWGGGVTESKTQVGLT